MNEHVIGPKVNPFKERYWRQFGGGPDPEMLKLMDPPAGLASPRTPETVIGLQF